MIDRINEHIEFHEANDNHKSDVAFLKEVKAYIEELGEADALNTMLAASQCLFDDGSGLTGDDGGTPYCAKDKLIDEMQKQLDDGKREADALAMSLWRQQYQKESPDFKLLDDTAGVISQINNMCSGMVKRSKLNKLEKENKQLLSNVLRAICLTRDYVGVKLLPAVDGWEWYDIGKMVCEKIPDNDQWVVQFKRTVAESQAWVAKRTGLNHE